MGSAIATTSFDEEKDSTDNQIILDDENTGIIPRVIRNLFELIADKEQQDPHSTYRIFVQFLEIYGEDIRDLLDETKTSKVTIRETPNGEVFVAGAKEELVCKFHLSFMSPAPSR